MPPLVPYIPETITVHLGAPDAPAENVTVPFADYVKNVVSSEIYPTWEDEAIRANTLAIISFALNRVFTEYYESRGYPFDITSSTAIDQKFIRGRNIYENVSQIVDEQIKNYIRRAGSLVYAAHIVKKTRGVEYIDLEAVSLNGRYRGRDRGLSLDLLGIEVAYRVAVGSLAETVGRAGYPEDGLCEGSLAGAAVSGERYVPDFCGRILFQNNYSPFRVLDIT